MMGLSRAHFFALGAITLWVSLAALGVTLQHVPPFMLTGISLLIGSLVALPLSGLNWRVWRLPWPTLALGVYGLFGYHFLLFMALRHAPPVQANLVNYLWPLGMVVMAPLFLPGTKLTRKHLVAAIVGFTGAALAITGGQGLSSLVDAPSWGYLWALAAAFQALRLEKNRAVDSWRRSRSSRPTLAPPCKRAVIRWMAIVDLPAPPFSLPITITRA